MKERGASVQDRRGSHWLVSPVSGVALLVGIAVHIAGFLLFRVDSNPLPDAKERRPFVSFVSAGSFADDTGLGEQAVLRDSAPLFIPTRWNAAQAAPVSSGIIVGGTFPAFEPDIDLVSDLRPSSPAIGAEFDVEAPLDLLASRFWRFFDGFGQGGDTPEPLPEPALVAAVERVDGAVSGVGETSTTLPVDASMPESAVGLGPVVYFVRVSGGGVHGAPTLAQSSGSAVLDQTIFDWLQRPDVRAQLPAGYLEITVYP